MSLINSHHNIENTYMYMFLRVIHIVHILKVLYINYFILILTLQYRNNTLVFSLLLYCYEHFKHTHTDTS